MLNSKWSQHALEQSGSPSTVLNPCAFDSSTSARRLSGCPGSARTEFSRSSEHFSAWPPPPPLTPPGRGTIAMSSPLHSVRYLRLPHCSSPPEPSIGFGNPDSKSSLHSTVWREMPSVSRPGYQKLESVSLLLAPAAGDTSAAASDAASAAIAMAA